ncbi:MBG domain-containing protein [Oceanospirillum maris]|uniref:MBG domain-containing protein n=1 Tax=Oceanospirillum maris TaxID=64977 RepID=UPI0004122436|nr:MBG domain-containing protein [Oceanospirillum maris]
MNHSLNHIFRLVWNHSLGAWCVAPEIARGKGKSRTQGQTSATCRLLPLALPLALLLGSTTAWADLPQGGNISAGQGQLTYQGDNLQVQQHSDKLAVDWQSFSIGKDNKVVFNQPDAQSVALNRVLGADVSRIQGAIEANGQVFLLNPNGVLFSPSAQVNTGGLVASTLELSNDDFMAGHFQFAGDSSAAVTNQGAIKASEGGTIALIAATIVNEGSLDATAGNVLLGAGRKVTLDMGGPVKLRVDEGALNTLIEQGGAIRADGGKVLLTARAAGELATSVINHSGITQAQTLTTGEKGEIVLLGDMQQGQLQVAGTLDASAPVVEGQGGDGGFIETSAAKVQINDSVQVTTLAENGNTGEWLIDPTDFYITADSATKTDSGIGASTLSAQLAGSDITIATVDTGSEAGDIYVDAPVSWSADTTLSLNADNNIYINQAITATGTNAGLVLNTGAGKDYAIASGAAITLSGSNAALNINGTDYTLIHDMAALDAIDTTGLSGAYALAKDLDASGTTYDHALVGVDDTNAFTGTFAGLGHTISDLTIENTAAPTDNWGLFGVNNGTIRDIGLVGGSVTVEGDRAVLTAGYLTGANAGTITNAYATGNVSMKQKLTGSQDIYAGGLVGSNNRGTITHAYATGDVSATSATGDVRTGGLVGNSYRGNITNAYATGAATANTEFNHASAGGLIGSSNRDNITNAYATGVVTASGIIHIRAGGLAGFAYGLGTVTNAYATGNVSATAVNALIIYSYVYAGGLVGQNDIPITNTYATGSVTGNATEIKVGGLVGVNPGSPRITASYWDTTTSGITTGVGSGNSSGVTGLTTTQLQDTNSFMTNASGWNFDTTWAPPSSGYYPQLYALTPVLYVKAPNIALTYGDSLGSPNTAAVSGGGPSRYAFGPNGDTLYAHSDVGSYSIPATVTSAKGINYRVIGPRDTLTIVPRAITVTANDQSKTYGAANPTLTYGVTSGYLVNGDSLSGTLASTASTASDVGSYDITQGSLAASSNYSLTYTPGILTVTPRTITVSAADQSRTYGDANPTLSYEITSGSLINGDSLSGALATTATTTSDIGIYDITQGSLANSNYSLTYAPGSLTVDPRAITVSADNQSRTYGAANPTLTYSLTSGSLVNTDSLSGTLATTANTASHVGSYDITQGSLDNSNYAITYQAGQLAIDKAALVVTANNASKTYDGNGYAGGNGVTYDGFVNGENSSVLSGALTYSGSAQGAINTGGYTLTVAGLSADNYNINYVDGTLNIDKAALTVTAQDASKTYDGQAWTGGNGVNYDGFATGEDASVLSGTLTYGGNAQGAINAGDYTLSVSGLSSTNYDISYEDGTLTIGKGVVDLMIRAQDAFKVYDGEAWFGGNGVDIEGLAAGETLADLDGSLVWGGSAQGAVNAGDYTITASGLSSPNYEIRFNNGTLTIGKANLTVTAKDASKTYDGQAWTGGNDVSYNGLVNGETASVLGGTLSWGGTAEGAVNAGDYTLAASGLSSTNYNINYVEGALTIDKTNLTVAAQHASKTYDGQAWTGGNDVSYDGLVNGETASVLGGTLSWGGSAQGAVNAGDYTLAASGLSANNYNINFVDGTLSIDQAPLIVTAKNASKTYDGLAWTGNNDVTYNGFVAGEDASVLGGTLSWGGTAQGAVNAGRYTITASGLSSPNYDIRFNNGVLTIDKANLTVAAQDALWVQDGSSWSGGNGVNYSGFVANEDASVLEGELLWHGSAEGANMPGQYRLSASGLAADNYQLTFIDGQLHIISPMEAAGPRYSQAVQQAQLAYHSTNNTELTSQNTQLRVVGTGILLP